MTVHMVCADRQIHNKELKYLLRLEEQLGIGQLTQQEKEKILTQDEDLIPINVLTQKVLPKQRNQAMAQILVMAYVDGCYSPLEQQMVEWVRQIWNLSSEEIQQLIEGEAYTAAHLVQDEDNSGSSLWDDLDYKTAVSQCAAIAHKDYAFAEAALQATGTTLDNLSQGIRHRLEAIWNKNSGNARAETAKEVVQQLENTKKTLAVEIVKQVGSVRESLDAKQRTLDYFTIAFIGKTKAGKSTLHAVMTDEGWDAIGVGRQRTTRLNRVYEWKKIRIIDTPGIGAPGGKTDEEIAQSIINESDAICYVVTNDSIQETEFEFLRLLKENAKPLIILLNVKNNLRDPRRLDHFLNNPDKLFIMDGQSGLGGHVERIRRYAKEHYANNYFEIVPVMLLAAQLSCEPEHEFHKSQLFKASRIENFLDEIWLSLVEHGAIRRSQNLLGCAVGNINNSYNWVKQQAKGYQNLTDKLKAKQGQVQKSIKTAEKDALESLQLEIKKIFQDALNTIPSFAEEYWDCSENSLKCEWEQKLKDIRFESRLETAYQKASETFGKQVQAALEEVGKDLQLIAKLGGLEFKFNEQNAGDEQNFLRIVGGILGVAGAIMAFIPPVAVIGLVIGIVAGVVGLISGFCKSKAQKRTEAVQNISSSLRNQLNSQQQATLTKAVKQFQITCEDVAVNVDTYFNQLIEGLEGIAKQLQLAQSKLDQTANNLNRAYAKRIIDWCLKHYEPMSNKGINDSIAEVSREFGHSMRITTKSLLQLQRTQDEINSVLQEDISIQSANVQSPKREIRTPPTPEAARKPNTKFTGAVGIDLGTTNSTVAVMRNGQPVVIAATNLTRDTLQRQGSSHC